ncbi:phytanoyl-CoA dioxygenase family protein [Horticoccus luteus]|uniref:Phytanoyl-CoA dioxygenase family protein n=1 Tax=Horticoccus luteus TaxID=2862869 RepID=A0A8F9TSG6_9BACT|nr:phytanoyl-CoA dioxygenase family protein [Horticoccus luteus]QYM78210.1 phytanoyl-CoA dioxygenase family protein [Horticoccus luteus]
MSTTTAALDLHSPYPLTADQIARFRRDGFVKLKDVLSADVLAHYGKIITDEVHRLNTMHLPLEQRDTYSKAFLQVINIWTKNDTVKEFCWSQRLGRIAAQLLGVDGVRMYHDQALYKEPNGGITPWHADQYYWPLSNANSVTAWIPLQKTTQEMGPLAFAAGSHQFEMGRDLVISDESEQRIGRSMKDHNYPLVDEPFDLGEVSFHYGWTFHRAGPNTSTQPRAVMTIIYIEDGIRLIEPNTKARQGDRAAFASDVEVGAVMNGKMTPVIYPTPGLV